jgi:hypothetical protein
MCLFKAFSVTSITIPDTLRTRSYYDRGHEQSKICLGRFVPACLNSRIPVYCSAALCHRTSFPLPFEGIILNLSKGQNASKYHEVDCSQSDDSLLRVPLWTDTFGWHRTRDCAATTRCEWNVDLRLRNILNFIRHRYLIPIFENGNITTIYSVETSVCERISERILKLK